MGWLTGWGRRKKQTITGSTAAQTNYQKEMTVHKGSGTDSATDVYCGGNCRDDFGDIRWTKADGTLMDYWIESYVAGDNAVIWVEVPAIPASPGTVSIYMYYDKSDATTTSDGDNTFIFFDHFPGFAIDTTKWFEDNGTATVTGSYVTCWRPAGANVRIRGKTTVNPSSHPYAMRCKTKITNSNGGHVGVYAGAGGSAPYTDCLRWGTHKASTANGGTSNTTFVSGAGTFYIYEILVTSSSQKYNIDGTEEASHTHDWSGVTTQAVGFQASDQNGAKVESDWILFRNYISPEPTWGVWGPEVTQTHVPHMGRSHRSSAGTTGSGRRSPTRFFQTLGM